MYRIIIRLPLAELWDDADPIISSYRRDLIASDIRALLQASPVRFVVAEIAAPLRWIPVRDCFDFWKAEAQRRMAVPTGARLEDYHGEYCYFASEWEAGHGLPIVVLSVAH